MIYAKNYGSRSERDSLALHRKPTQTPPTHQ